MNSVNILKLQIKSHLLTVGNIGGMDTYSSLQYWIASISEAKASLSRVNGILL